ncbi:hypothetical protein GA0061091_12438 [Gordonia sp. v-85]|nr:hypothetical protein GA0061091_12438 [Gordonia sp. v-85]
MLFAGIGVYEYLDQLFDLFRLRESRELVLDLRELVQLWEQRCKLLDGE